MLMHKSGVIWKQLSSGKVDWSASTESPPSRGCETPHDMACRDVILREAEWLHVVCSVHVQKQTLVLRAAPKHDRKVVLSLVQHGTSALQLLPCETAVENTSCFKRHATKLSSSFTRLLKLTSPQGSVILCTGGVAASHELLQQVEWAQQGGGEGMTPTQCVSKDMAEQNSFQKQKIHTCIGAGRLSHYLFVSFSIAAIKFTRVNSSGDRECSRVPQVLFLVLLPRGVVWRGAE
jgi:hypothetical protein